MAQLSVLSLIPNSAHTQPSGTVMTITGERREAAAYYVARSNLQTLSWSLASSFVGTIAIQASLVTDPGSNDWTTVYTIPSNTTKSGYTNIDGNYTWIRAVVSAWTDGTINTVNLSY